MIIKYCKNCKKRFRARCRTNCYCSMKCMRKFIPKLISKARMGMKFTEEHKANLRKNHTRPMLGRKFSKEHREKIRLAKLGSNNPNWKGGRRINYFGYVELLVKNHPFSNKDGYVHEHRFVVEKIIKRFLSSQEIVHHINGDKTDNRPENLYLFENSSNHTKCHRNKWLIVSNLI